MHSRAPRMDQLVAGLADGDATSHAVLAIRDALRSLGYESEIYALPEFTDPAIRDACRDARSYAGGAGDILAHHYGLLSDATDIFRSARARKILLYHNITPSDYFRGYSDALMRAAGESRDQLRALADECMAVWADSRFNAGELEDLGVSGVRTLPLPFCVEALERTPDPVVTDRLRAPLTTILSVGRVAPNKCIEELMEAYARYHTGINPYSRLLIVGSPRSTPKYFTYLRMLAHDLHVPNICFEGFASPAGLAAYYELADLLVCTSRHEGYGLPLLEGMVKGLPVISRATGGTPEAMGDGGVQYADLSAAQLAALIHLVHSDAALRNEVLASQQKRLREIRERDLAAELSALLGAAPA